MKHIQKNLSILVKEFSNGSINKFANDYLGERSQNLTNWIQGKKSPNLEKLSILFETIEDLSLEWLFRGKGERLISKERKELERKMEQFEDYKKRAELYEKILYKSVENLNI